MRRLAHISDLHFGKEEPVIAEALLREIAASNVHLVVISGDLTQRARPREFAAARAYLDRLPAPYLVVPGNHDIPMFHVVRRFLAPLDDYQRYITEDLAPVYQDAEVAVVGVNTARSLTLKSGRISEEQMEDLRRVLGALPSHLIKVVVTHHPFIGPDDDRDADLVGRAGRALQVLDQGGVDLLLAGHLHAGFAGDVRVLHPTTRSIMAVQCGTSISTRVRGEPNSYNLIDLEPGFIAVSERHWEGGGFVEHAHRTYVRDGDWQARPPSGRAPLAADLRTP